MELVLERSEMSDVRSVLYQIYGRVSSVFGYGSGVASGVSAAIFWSLLRLRRLLHSRVVDKRVLKFLSPPMIGAVGCAVEIGAKLILSFTLANWTSYVGKRKS